MNGSDQVHKASDVPYNLPDLRVWNRPGTDWEPGNNLRMDIQRVRSNVGPDLRSAICSVQEDSTTNLLLRSVPEFAVPQPQIRYGVNLLSQRPVLFEGKVGTAFEKSAPWLVGQLAAKCNFRYHVCHFYPKWQLLAVRDLTPSESLFAIFHPLSLALS